MLVLGLGIKASFVGLGNVRLWPWPSTYHLGLGCLGTTYKARIMENGA